MIGNIESNKTGSYWGDFYREEPLATQLADIIEGDNSIPFWKRTRLIMASDAGLDKGCAAYGLVPVGHSCTGNAIL